MDIVDIVLLLPGQGSQKVGMGRDLYEASAPVREVFATVDAAAGAPISALAFEGPDEELRFTNNAQPALLAHSAAVWAMLGDLLAPRVRAAAGHSLGEFSAYHVAGALSLSDAARVVRRRGELMREAARSRAGGMSAVIGTSTVPIDALCAQASTADDLVVPANFNSPEQVVVSGDKGALERFAALAKEAGIKRCLPLPVSGAFHSPLMEPAVPGFSEVLRGASLTDPRVPVYANVDGSAVRTAAAARPLLEQQLTAPVQWTTVMTRLAEAYPTALFLEIGTGSVLCGLAKRIAPQITTRAVGTLAEVEQLMQELPAAPSPSTEASHAH